MLLIDCPYCGARPELEFSHGGQAHIARAHNPADLSAQEWTDFLYMRDNIKGVHAERWRHVHGCGRYFNALRDTTTDHFLATYKVGERVAERNGPGIPSAGGGAGAANTVGAAAIGTSTGAALGHGTGDLAGGDQASTFADTAGRSTHVKPSGAADNSGAKEAVGAAGADRSKGRS